MSKYYLSCVLLNDFFLFYIEKKFMKKTIYFFYTCVTHQGIEFKTIYLQSNVTQTVL